jgi:hypothetical protein
MARRSPVDEKPFRPLDVSVLNSVVKHVAAADDSAPASPTAIVRPEQTNTARREPEVRMVSKVAPMLARLDQEKRILFTRAETHAIERLTNNLSVRLNAQIKVSHIIRALTALLLNAEAQIHQRASERAQLTRPPNGDLGALQRFEREIALLLAEALRDAGLPRTLQGVATEPHR